MHRSSTFSGAWLSVQLEGWETDLARDLYVADATTMAIILQVRREIFLCRALSSRFRLVLWPCSLIGSGHGVDGLLVTSDGL